MFPCAWLALLPALAQPVEDLDGASEAAPVSSASDDDGPRRGVNARYRYLWLPRGVLNPWYYASDETRLPRPNASAHVVGAEFTVDPMPATFSAWAEAWAANLDEGYWDDIETPQDNFDGDWIRPEGIGMIAIGGNFGHEWSLTPTTADAWLGFAVGGGLGLGIPWGSFSRWQPGWATSPQTLCQPLSPSEIRQLTCEPDEVTKAPPVLPIIDITLALKLHVLERGVLRFEAGIHDVPFIGFAAGGQF